MADIEPSLVARLLAVPAVTALAGNRIGPPPVQQAGALPALTYRRAGGSSLVGMTANLGIATPIYELTMWATTKTAAKALAEAVLTALARYEDDGVPEWLDAVLLNERDDFDPETELHYVEQDWELWHRE